MRLRLELALFESLMLLVKVLVSEGSVWQGSIEHREVRVQDTINALYIARMSFGWHEIHREIIRGRS